MQASLGEIAEVINAELIGDSDCKISGVGTLKNATPEQISFLSNPRYSSYLKKTKAAAVVVTNSEVENCPGHSLVADDPYLAFVKAVRYLNPESDFDQGIHPSAVIEQSATLSPTTYIGANTYIGNSVVINENVYIGPGCVVEDRAELGKFSKLFANVSIGHDVIIGERVLIHPGVVIGSDGFGLANDSGKWLKIPQLGSVEIMDDVEIGTNTAIDRGSIENTIIEEGVKIDNLVQIGHNAVVGAHTVIAGCAALAGSVTIGKRCMIGGATAIAGHNTIADDVVITGLSGVTNSIREAGTYSGSMTTTDNKIWRKNMVRLKHLDELVRRINDIEDRLVKIKSNRE